MEKKNCPWFCCLTKICLGKKNAGGLGKLLLFACLALCMRVPPTEGALPDTYITDFRGGTTAAYTFTFDDGSSGQWQYAIPVLNEHNIHGTFFLIGASVQAWYSGIGRIHVPQMLNMAAAGHEIGCHTFNHLSLTGLDDAGIHTQMELNRSFFSSYGINVVSMAYPYSATDERVQAIVGQYIDFARGGAPITTNSRSWHELNPLNLRWSSQSKNLYECVDTAIASGTWAIGVFHQVGLNGVSGVPTQDEFISLVKYVVTYRDAGVLWIDTVREVASYIRERSAATIRPHHDTETNTIKVSLKVGLGYPYIVPLTLRTDIGNHAIKSISQSQMPLPYKMLSDQNGKLIQYDVVPDGGDVIIQLTAQ